MYIDRLESTDEQRVPVGLLVERQSGDHLFCTFRYKH